jgi:aspartate aminotransferase
LYIVGRRRRCPRDPPVVEHDSKWEDAYVPQTLAPPASLFAERIDRLGTEAAFALGARIAEVEARGQRVIRCNLGQPDFPLPGHIADAVKRALDRGLTTYCDPQGLPELRRAVARSVGQRRGLDIDPDRVVVYPGGRPSIGFAHIAYNEADEEVIYPSPGYPLFESFIPYFRCVPVPVLLREENGFGLTRAELEPLLGDRTGMIFLNFPSNPTGGVATRAQLQDLSELILDRTSPSVRIYSDEAYEAITFDGDEHVSIASMPGMEDRNGCRHHGGRARAARGRDDDGVDQVDEGVGSLAARRGLGGRRPGRRE